MSGHTPYIATINGTQYTVTPKPMRDVPLFAAVTKNYETIVFKTPEDAHGCTTPNNPAYLRNAAQAYLQWVGLKEQNA